MPIETRKITNREQWLEWRRQYFNASNTGALFNCHPYTTTLRIYAEKRGTEFVHEDNAAMRRGRWLEPAVAKAVEELRPEWKLEPANVYLIDPDLRLGATPDFFITGDPRGRGVCQTKTVAPSVYAREWNEGLEVPLWIILQASVEAMLANADFIVVAALLVDAHNMDVSIHEMPRNPAAEQKIQDAVLNFWRCVDNGIEPEPDFARDADTIRAIWKQERKDLEVDFTGDNRIPELLDRRVHWKAIIKNAEEALEHIDAELKYAMKDAAVATGIEGFRLTYKTSHFKEYSVPARNVRILRVTDQREKME